MGQHMVLDVRRCVAQLVELGQASAGLRPLDHEAGLHIAERALQLRVGQRPRGVFLEIERGRSHAVPYAVRWRQ